MKLIHMLADLLFPPKCVLCRKVLEENETDLCRNCWVEALECPILPAKFSFLDSWTAIWYYEDPARSSILRYKFSNARYYALCYGRLLAMKLQERFPEGFDCITWVPVSRLRRFRRGYDQVELLAKAVGKELGQKPVRLLKKIRNNPPQSGISGQAERRANVLGAYRITDATAVAGKRILLLDDVITTGATAGECARVLLTAGVSQVHLGAVAAARHHEKTK
jgi:ComF family protein